MATGTPICATARTARRSRREDTITAQKIFHVSPFQPVDGRYDFRFDIRPDRIGIWIDYTSAAGRAFHQPDRPARAPDQWRHPAACLRRPFGSRRVLALIHWQALKLWLKKVRFHSRPLPPKEDVSQ